MNDLVSMGRHRTGLRRLGAALIAVAWSAGGVQAKDLPRRQAEEVKTVDTACAYLGEGYVRAPGSDTCVKVSGHVRADAAVIWGR